MQGDAVLINSVRYIQLLRIMFCTVKERVFLRTSGFYQIKLLLNQVLTQYMEIELELTMNCN